MVKMPFSIEAFIESTSISLTNLKDLLNDFLNLVSSLVSTVLETISKSPSTSTLISFLENPGNVMLNVFSLRSVSLNGFPNKTSVFQIGSLMLLKMLSIALSKAVPLVVNRIFIF